MKKLYLLIFLIFFSCSKKNVVIDSLSDIQKMHLKDPHQRSLYILYKKPSIKMSYPPEVIHDKNEVIKIFGNPKDIRTEIINSSEVLILEYPHASFYYKKGDNKYIHLLFQFTGGDYNLGINNGDSKEKIIKVLGEPLFKDDYGTNEEIMYSLAVVPITINFSFINNKLNAVNILSSL